MKKLLMHSFQLILISIITLNAGNLMAQTPENYVKVKGHLMNIHEKVTIQIFEKVNVNSWRKVKEKSQKNNYIIKLDPTLDYQVWFTDSKGNVKILYHSSGTKGRWLQILDVDFNSNYYCLLKQVDNKEYAINIIFNVELALESEL